MLNVNIFNDFQSYLSFQYVFYAFFCWKGKHLKRNFIDKLRVYVKSGNGGVGHRKLGGIGGDGNIFLI